MHAEVIESDIKNVAQRNGLSEKEVETILEKRTQEYLRKCFSSWGKEVIDGIEEVSMDLWSGYKNAR